MKHYELLCIVPGKYTEEETEAIGKKVGETIKKIEGEITATDNLGNNRLAYEIKGSQAGTFLVMEFNAEPARINELDGILKLMSEVARYQISNKKEKSKEEIEKEKLRQEKMAQKAEAEKTEKAVPAEKVSIEELDKKLGEILSGDII